MVNVVGPKLVEAQSRVAGMIVKDLGHPGKEQAPIVPTGDESKDHRC